MKKKLLISLIIVTLVAVLIGSLQDNISSCLPPPLNTVPTAMGASRLIKSFRIPPLGHMPSLFGMPSWWQVQPDNANPLKIDRGLGVVRAIVAKNNIVWVAYSNDILRYDKTTSESKYYRILDESGMVFVVHDIISLSTDDLWVLANSPGSNIVALASYNAQSDQFNVVHDKDGIFQQGGKSDNAFTFVNSQVLAVTAEKKILMPYKGRLISYDPKLNVVEFLLPQDFATVNLDYFNPITAIEVNKNIVWFTVANDMDLRSLDLSSLKLTNHGHIPSLLDDPQWAYYMKSSYRPIAVDNQGQVWMGYFSKLKMDDNGMYRWQEVDYPPHFIVVDDPDYEYIWGSLDSIYTSPTGELWFSSHAGLIKYDPNKDQWCKSAPIKTPFVVTDDGQGNLWMAVTSGDYYNLYKYQLVY